jgi:hypothetical protein
MIMTGEIENLGEKQVSFLTRTDPGSNSGSDMERPVTNPLSHGTNSIANERQCIQDHNTSL